MDWIKDKKNLPIVGGLGALILIGAIVLILFEMGVIGGGASPDESASATPAAPVVSKPVTPPGAGPLTPPAGPSAFGGPPGSSPGSPATTATAAKPGTPGQPPPPAAPANVAKGPDPFVAPGFPPPTPKYTPGFGTGARTAPRTLRSILPDPLIARLPSNTPSTPGIGPGTQTPVPPDVNIRINPVESPNMRVSGVVLTGTGVHAVLESGGRSQQVQPGDTLDNGGKVLSIQSDGLTMRAENGTLIHVPLSSGSGGSTVTPGYPGA